MNPDSNPLTNPPSLNEQSSKPGFSRLAKVLIAVVIVLAGVLVVSLVYRHYHKPSNSITVSLPAKIAPAEVSITSSGFVPATIKVKAGQAVVWVNHDSKAHIVASDPYPTDNTLPGLNSKQDILSGGSYTYIFNSIGTYTYHDNLNPSAYEGTVIVSAKITN